MTTANPATSSRRTAAQHALAEHLRLVSSGRIQEWVDLFAPDGILEFRVGYSGVWFHRTRGHHR
jgi:hypothetical protein